MKSIHSAISALLFLMVLNYGCATTKLSDYKAKSNEESALLSYFVECDAAYQRQDYTKWLACFHDDAKIRIFQTDAVTRMDVLKPAYKNYLAAGRASDMQLEVINPVINIDGDKASLKYVNGIVRQMRGRFDFVKDKESWQITRMDWTYRGE